MTRLFDATHGQVQEFLEKLAAAGLTAEHLEKLHMGDARLQMWVSMLDQDVEPKLSATPVLLKDLFPAGGRLFRLLHRAGFVYLNQVAECTEDDLWSLRGCGEKSIRQLTNLLHEHGLQLKTINEGPSALIHGWAGDGRYRAEVSSMAIRWLVKLDRRQDFQDEGAWNHRLQDFLGLSHAKRKRHYTQSGLAKIDAFIRDNGL